MDLAYLVVVVAVFGMCAAAAAPAAHTTPSSPSAERSSPSPRDNGKRSRSLSFRSPYQPQDGPFDRGTADDLQRNVVSRPDDEVMVMDDDDLVDLRLSSRARDKPDSPVYFIRLPPQPYAYVPGYGYVSQPTRLEPPPFAQRPHSPFLNVPLGYVSNAKPVGVYTLPQQQHPFQQQFSGIPPYKRPPQPATTPPPPPPQDDSDVYDLDKGPYAFNGRPSDVFLLQSAYDDLYSEVLQNIYP